MKIKPKTPLQKALVVIGLNMGKTEKEMADWLGICQTTFTEYKRTEGFRLSQFKRLVKAAGLSDEEILKVIRG